MAQDHPPVALPSGEAQEHTAPSAPPGVTTIELYRLFQEYSDRPFVFVQPGGNAGDYLIYKGAEKLSRLVGLDFTSVTHDEFMQADYGLETVVYIHGSGGINPVWSGTPILELEKAVHHEGVVIHGPSTYWNDLDFLKEQVVERVSDRRCERLVLMARERVSYDLMREVQPAGVDLLLDHDTALNLARVDLEALLPERKEGAYTFYAIREDKEARETDHRAYFSVWRDSVSPGQTFEGWLRLHAEAKEIVTNRLHSSICGSILGIPTTLLPNSYFKNRAVWERSLEERGVRWANHVEVDAVSKLVHRIGPARRLMRRGRVQRFMQRLHGVG